MKPLTKLTLATKKLLHSPKRTALMAAPILISAMFATVVTIEATSVNSIIDQRILQPLAEQNRVIELFDFRASLPFGGNSGFTDDTINSTSEKDHVEQVSSVDQLAVTSSKSTDLIDGETVELGKINGIEPNFASKFTSEKFEYTPGQPIPIVLSQEALSKQVLEGDEIKINFGEQSTVETPIDFEPLTDDPSSLVGKEFTASIGDLPVISEYEENASFTQITYKRRTDAEIEKSNQDRKAALSKYWNFDALTKPIEYKFVVVGIQEGAGGVSSNYVPKDFIVIARDAYVNRQLNARNNTTIPKDKLSQVYVGDTIRGGQLQPQLGGGGPLGGGGSVGLIFNESGEQVEQPERYIVPGLVIKQESFQDSNISEVTNFEIIKSAVAKKDTLLILIDSADNRKDVIDSLKDDGYQLFDQDTQGALQSAKSAMSSVAKYSTLALLLFTGMMTALISAKYVGESRKEIGTLRALGMQKNDVQSTVLLQLLLNVAVALVLGAALGILLAVIGAHTVMESAFSKLLESSEAVLPPTAYQPIWSDFVQFNFQSLLLSVSGLWLVALIASLPLSRQAARMDPVVAIQDE